MPFGLVSSDTGQFLTARQLASKDVAPQTVGSFYTVSATGLSGKAGIQNNGADFGPDTKGTVTQGVQEAVNMVSPGGGQVRLLPGTFTASTTIIIGQPNILLTGLGTPTGTKLATETAHNQSVIQAASGINVPVLLISLNGSDPTASPSGFRGCLVQNVVIDGNKSNQTSGDGVHIAAADVVFRDTEVRNASNNGVVNYTTVPAVGGENDVFWNCFVHDCGSNGFLVQHADTRIVGGEYFNNSGAGIQVVSGAGGFELTGTNVYGNAQGIVFDSTNGSLEHCIVNGSDSDSNSNNGIQLLAPKNHIRGVTFSGCAVWNNSTGTGSTTSAHVYASGTVHADFVGCEFMAQSGSPYSNLGFEVTAITTAVSGVSGYGLSFSNCLFQNDNRAIAVTASLNSSFHNCKGLNPLGFGITTPAVPAGTAAVTNSFPYSVVVSLTGALGSRVIDPSGNNKALGQDALFILDPGAQYFAATSSPAAWIWYAL